MTKDVIEAILERRTIRKMKNDSIPQATVGRILEAAIMAPNAGNLQPWKFYVVFNSEIKSKLAAAANNQNILKQAPVCIVVCSLPEVSESKYGLRGRDLYSIQDTAAAVQNINLAATGYGLATCWVGAFDEKQVGMVLDLPNEERPVAILPLGYPDIEAKVPARKSVDDVTKILL